MQAKETGRTTPLSGHRVTELTQTFKVCQLPITSLRQIGGNPFWRSENGWFILFS
jgi:hypothetical protein